MIRNLGKVLTIIARAEAEEMDRHADVDAFNAPSECHALVSRGEARRERLARKHAEAVAERPWRIIKREAEQRGCTIHYLCRPYSRLLYSQITHPYLTGEG